MQVYIIFFKKNLLNTYMHVYDVSHIYTREHQHI